MTLTNLPLSCGDQSVVYLERGKGEPLLFIHGVGMQHAAWQPQIDIFAKSHRVIAVNLPGHGGSTPLPVGSQLPDFVEWLHEFILALNCGPTNIAGHSMGALIAGGYVARHPENVLRVAVLNGVYCRNEDARKAVLLRAKDILNGGIDVCGPIARWFDNGPRDVEAGRKARLWLSQMEQQNYATTYDAFARGDATYANCWNKVNCPALFLTGDDDPNSTPDMAITMAANTPNGKICIIPGHRHMAHLTTPVEVNSALSAWLNEPVNLLREQVN